jgi:hypothetical protein
LNKESRCRYIERTAIDADETESEKSGYLPNRRAYPSM